MYKKKSYTKRPRKSVSRPRKVIKKPSKFLKRTIQTMIAKNVEDKMAYHSTGNSLVYFNSGINSSGDVLQVLPDVSTGTTENARIGDTVRGKTLVIRGYIQLEKNQEFGDVANKRIAVRLMVVSSKKFKAFADLQSNAAFSLIQKGGTSSRFEGYISDLFAPINTEQYVKHYDKIHYLSQSYVAQQVGSSTPSVVWSQDISKGIRFFTIRIPMRGKKLIYSQSSTSDLQPVNFAPILCAGYAHLSGGSPDVIETSVGICYDVTMTYEDA